jgi:GTP-binding protein
LLAQNGERGMGRKKHGKNGQDLVIKVPRGTVLVDEKTKEQIGDLSDIPELIVAKGGNGGYGNAHFISSTRQAPRVSELGEPGEEREITLELKMIADVGFVGLPNVGKSTLLSVISAAKPKIADYEFTTLIPNLGVVEEGTFGVSTGFIVADIPGLIEGASKGKGLGDEFLRHVERTRILVHIIDATHPDLGLDYKTIRNELKFYKIDLTKRPEVIAINKIDTLTEDELTKKIKELKKAIKKNEKIFPISAVAHKNLPDLLHEIEKKLREIPKEKEAEKETFKTFTIKDVVSDNVYSVEKVEGKYVVSGKKIEKFAIRTDFANPYGVARFRDIMAKSGVDKELKRKGAVLGDIIKVSGKEFTL